MSSSGRRVVAPAVGGDFSMGSASNASAIACGAAARAPGGAGRGGAGLCAGDLAGFGEAGVEVGQAGEEKRIVGERRSALRVVHSTVIHGPSATGRNTL